MIQGSAHCSSACLPTAETRCFVPPASFASSAGLKCVYDVCALVCPVAPDGRRELRDGGLTSPSKQDVARTDFAKLLGITKIWGLHMEVKCLNMADFGWLMSLMILFGLHIVYI